MQWIFTPKSPSTRTRDPISGEYFSNEAIDNAGQALVREAIQNSLDARVGSGSVRIRSLVSGDDVALPPTSDRRWFKGGAYTFTCQRRRRTELASDELYPFHLRQIAHALTHEFELSTWRQATTRQSTLSSTACQL
jgi:hypothetical protein